MKRQNYKNRIIDQQVEEYLKAFGAVCIEGPKWCGKTWTSSYHSKKCNLYRKALRVIFKKSLVGIAVSSFVS